MKKFILLFSMVVCFLQAMSGVAMAAQVQHPAAKHPTAAHQQVAAKHPTAAHQQVAAKHPTAVKHQVVAVKNPAVAAKHPATAVKHQVVAVKNPAVAAKHPATAVKHQVVAAHHSATALKHPAVAVKHPAVAPVIDPAAATLAVAPVAASVAAPVIASAAAPVAVPQAQVTGSDQQMSNLVEQAVTRVLQRAGLIPAAAAVAAPAVAAPAVAAPAVAAPAVAAPAVAALAAAALVAAAPVVAPVVAAPVVAAPVVAAPVAAPVVAAPVVAVTPAPVVPVAPFTVVQGFYGPAVDALSQVQKLLVGNTITLPNNYRILVGADPAPRVKKSLRISYTNTSGATQVASYPDNTAVAISNVKQINWACYVPLDGTVDITAKAVNWLSGNTITLPLVNNILTVLNNPATGITTDPFPANIKNVVLVVLNNQTKAYSMYVSQEGAAADSITLR